MKRLFTPFHRLQWKLTLSYTLVTVTAVLLLEVIVLIFLGRVLLTSDLLPLAISEALESIANEEIAPYLEQSPPDHEAIEAWILEAKQTGRIRREDSGWQVQFSPMYLNAMVVVGTDGLIVAAYPPDRFPQNQSIATCLSPEESDALQAALKPGEGAEQRIARGADGNIVVSVTILGQNMETVGALLLNLSLPSGVSSIMMFVLSTIFPSLIVVTAFAAVVGSVFGFLTARGISRRLRTVSQAADSWSRGDFSALAHDSSADELGQLAQRLNRMAEQLENLLETRQELATLEERNRLARDLHDSVKQQVFAISMNLGAARELWEKDPQSARHQLDTATSLARQAQRELTALIQTLRPAQLEGKGLAQALHDHLLSWEQQTGISITSHIEIEDSLPLEIEQALFRVAQEALANVARHSQATQVTLSLSLETAGVILKVSDNGRGFDLNMPSKGMGLRSMKERLMVLGGEIRLESDSRGTTLMATLPIEKLRETNLTQTD